MVRRRELSPQPLLDEACLLELLREEGIKPVHARTVWTAAINLALSKKGEPGDHTGIAFTDDVPTVPKRLNGIIRDKFAVFTSKVAQVQKSSDGTTKLLVELQDGQRVESVIIPHLTASGTFRNTLCVSSQIGCQMGCTFCATGTMGLKGDLLGGEILEQLLHANMIAPIRNIVFMGMGEPLNNYEAVLSAIRGMVDPKRFSLSQKHITLSTVGVVPMMKRLTRDAPDTQLALSLHAPNQELRNKIVPSASAFKLPALMAALDAHVEHTPAPPSHSPSASAAQNGSGSSGAAAGGAAVLTSDDFGGLATNIGSGAGGAVAGGGGTGGGAALATRSSLGGKKLALIEYVLLNGVNDTVPCAHELGELLRGRPCVVNLIPYNATLVEGDAFKEPPEEDIQKFSEIVKTYGLFVTIRRHHGRDIDGACGQLALKTEAEKAAGCGSADIEDIGAKAAGATAAAAGVPSGTSPTTKPRKGGSRTKGAPSTQPQQKQAAAANAAQQRNGSGADAAGGGERSPAGVGSRVGAERAMRYVLLAGAVAAVALVAVGVARVRSSGRR